jgi:hypothetical protein
MNQPIGILIDRGYTQAQARRRLRADAAAADRHPVAQNVVDTLVVASAGLSAKSAELPANHPMHQTYWLAAACQALRLLVNVQSRTGDFRPSRCRQGPSGAGQDWIGDGISHWV